MAAYCKMDDLQYGLTACTSGSSPGPTLRNKYGKPLRFMQILAEVCGPVVSVEQVQVLILDINDNTPTFSESQYVVDVSEGVAPGTEILAVSAIDLDEDQHLFYTIHSVTSPASNNKFKINSISGASRRFIVQSSDVDQSINQSIRWYIYITPLKLNSQNHFLHVRAKSEDVA